MTPFECVVQKLFNRCVSDPRATFLLKTRRNVSPTNELECRLIGPVQENSESVSNKIHTILNTHYPPQCSQHLCAFHQESRRLCRAVNNGAPCAFHTPVDFEIRITFILKSIQNKFFKEIERIPKHMERTMKQFTFNLIGTPITHDKRRKLKEFFPKLYSLSSNCRITITNCIPPYKWKDSSIQFLSFFSNEETMTLIIQNIAAISLKNKGTAQSGKFFVEQLQIDSYAIDPLPSPIIIFLKESEFSARTIISSSKQRNGDVSIKLLTSEEQTKEEIVSMLL